ncbi:DUF2442 domain-containing protein [Terrimonas pollutisoli]|uniref:DUF2442 domain-containing protein n=1 Tax=Terrimonas pollutisoli TaxID=3034147 RepID=UPI0023ECAD55|nr:DUF2442 domain-containing protein [Terrimonas sp. H1YJ31]
MGNSVHLSQKRKVRSDSKKAKEENITVLAARYISDFSIAVTFSSGRTQLVNFLPLFEKYVKGDNLKYFAPERFKKFIVKNGNIYWGRNEDVIFPVSVYFKDSALQTETSDEILYII